jgi:hypothetical protein
MRKFIISAALVGAALLAAATVEAGYWSPWGFIVTCGWVWTVYGPVWVCG